MSVGEAPAKSPAQEAGPVGQDELTDTDLHLNLALQAKDRATAQYKDKQFAAARDNWQQALGQLESGAAGDIQNPDIKRLQLSLYLNLAQVGLQLKEYDDVVERASAALKLDSDNAKALYRRGCASEALGKIQAAARDLQNAARIEPKNADVRKKYEELKKRALSMDQQEDEEIPPVHNILELPRAFIDVAIGECPAKRLVFALYLDTTPKTVDNFRQLCTGEHKGITAARGKPFHFKGSLLHRMIPGLMVQGGDFENANGTGGESIYGRRFPDEGFRDKHTRRGLLAMANDGPNTNGSNFFVTFAAAEHLDRKHVIFGEVVSGAEFLDELEQMPTNDECRPLTDCVITACGECGPGGKTADSS